MENASKALLIAGGVLIALIILAMFIIMFNRMANLQEEQEEQLKTEQLAAFNAEYEAFNKKVMYGVDVITLINKVNENNKKYSGNTDYTIDMLVTLGDGTVIGEENGTGSLKGDNEQTIFTCESMKYNNLGRVCNIVIKAK